MSKLLAFFVVVFALFSFAFSQSTKTPAYLTSKMYEIPLNDKVCEPLTYIDSETGQGNLIATIVEAIKNKQILAYSNDGLEELNWDEVQDALGRSFDTTYVVDYDLNGNSYTGDLVVESPYDLSNIEKINLHFLTSFDGNRNEISQQLVMFCFLRTVFDNEGYNLGFKRVFTLVLNDLGLKKLLSEQKSMLPGYLHLSFLDLLSSLHSKSFLISERFVSFSYANEIANESNFELNTTCHDLIFPTAVDKKKGKLVVRKIAAPEEVFHKEPLYANSFKLAFGSIDSLLEKAGDLSAFPLFFPPSSRGGFRSLSNLVNDAFQNFDLDFFKSNSNGFFDSKMDSSTAHSIFFEKDTIEVSQINDDESSEMVQYIFERVVSINGFYILEYSEGKSRIPIAICPLTQELNEYGENAADLKPICWIPLNSSFRSLLEKQEAYWPGKLPVMSLWDYFCANYYGGEIISEQKITQAEWTKMLEVLK